MVLIDIILPVSVSYSMASCSTHVETYLWKSEGIGGAFGVLAILFKPEEAQGGKLSLPTQQTTTITMNDSQAMKAR
jgi:hypothetical protein